MSNIESTPDNTLIEHLMEEIVDQPMGGYMSRPCVVCDNQPARHFIRVKASGHFLTAGLKWVDGFVLMDFRSNVVGEKGTLRNVAIGRIYHYCQHVGELTVTVVEHYYSWEPVQPSTRESMIKADL